MEITACINYLPAFGLQEERDRLREKGIHTHAQREREGRRERERAQT